MKTLYLVISCVACLFCKAQQKENLYRTLQQIADDFTNKGLPGLVVSVRQNNNEQTISAGYADLEKGRLMTADNQLMVASVTKMFVAVITLKLAEQGRLSLYQPITMLKCGHLFKNIANADKITINHLLNHTSGLPDFIKHPAFFLNVLNTPAHNWKQADLIKFLQKQKPLFNPGEKGVYSNSNFLLLTIILDNELGEKVKHHHLLKDLIFEPLQLNNTFYSENRQVPQLAAKGYAELYNDKRLINLIDFNTGGSGNGYSGVYSTAGDLQKFFKALFIERTLLSDSSLKEMAQFIDDAEDKEVSFGLGVWKDFKQYGEDRTAIGHRGRDIAYTADVWWFPKQSLSLVVLSNCGAVMNCQTTTLYKAFRKQLLELLLNIKES